MPTAVTHIQYQHSLVMRVCSWFAATTSMLPSGFFGSPAVRLEDDNAATFTQNVLDSSGPLLVDMGRCVFKASGLDAKGSEMRLTLVG
jgi:hypothetical protein